jgi:hypothetical protein
VTPARRRSLHRRALTASLLLAVMFSPAARAADHGCRQLDQHGLSPPQRCHQSAPGQLEISPASLAALEFDSDGLAAVLVSGQHYYLRRDGRFLPVITYDNGPDYFEEGLTRAVIDGKLGYYDRQLQPAFAARFDWGWPFQNGIAEVCEGCRPGEADNHGHRSMIGGRHFHIDRHGMPLPPQR